MKKLDELANPKSCMNRAHDNEMTFVLLGRDLMAPAVIREWCRLRCLHGKNSPKDPQITEALECAKKMEANREVAAPAPQIEDLCPFHDLGHEFSKCTCPMDHPNRVNAESPLISTLRELIATTLDEADLKRQIVNAVEGSNMTINTPAPRPLTEAELKRWSRDRCEGLGDQSGRMENL